MAANNPDEEVLFNTARKMPPAQREEYLLQACCDDAVRSRVRALLRVHDEAADFLQAPAGTLDMPVVDHAGARIGPYKLLEKLGEGGMGVVWMAEQCEPVKRLVALKVVKAGLDSTQVIVRFEAERQALALMDHPNIAKVLGAGTTTEGLALALALAPRPYFVMELVKGVAITKYCDERRLSPRDRLALFIPVCQAVQHAHQKGIIHRDLKPSNVMIALYDGRPVPKVIDFGVAKAAGQKLTEKTFCTSFGAIVGTLEYMSPEQAELNQLDVDTRSDIYSLGVLLYELLTGSTPLDRARLQEAALLETLRMIREEEPPRPSVRLSSSEKLAMLSQQRQTEPAKLPRLMRGELDWIVMKALEKNRDRRYETASALAQDIQRFLHDEPVQAGPPALAYRLRKFVRRNQGAVLAAALVLLALLAGIIGTTWGLLESVEQRDQAKLEKLEAVKQSGLAEAARNDADRHRQQAEEAGAQKARELARAESYVYYLQFREAWQHFQEGDLVRCRRALDECRPEFRGPEHGYLTRRLTQQGRTLPAPPEDAGPLALSADGKRLFAAAHGGAIKVWDVESGKVTDSIRGDGKPVFSLTLTDDGKRLIAVSAGGIMVWDAASCADIRALRGPADSIMGPVLSGDGKRLAAICQHRPVGNVPPTRVWCTVWDLETDTEFKSLHADLASTFSRALSPDGTLLAAGRLTGGDIVVWDVAADKAFRTLRGHSLEVLCLAVTRDGKRLFSGSGDQTIKVWDLETGRRIYTLSGHTNRVAKLALSADGKLLVSEGDGHDHVIKIWDAQQGQLLRNLRGHTGRTTSLALSGDGKRLVSWGPDRASGALQDVQRLKVWDLQSGKEARTLPGLSGRVISQTLSRDGRMLLLGRGLEVKRGVDYKQQYFPADGSIQIWDLETSKKIDTLPGHTGDVVSLAMSADSKRLFSASAYNGITFGKHDDTIKIWDRETGKEIRTLRGYSGGVITLLPSKDGKRLIVGCSDNTIRVWDVATGEQTQQLRWVAAGGHEGLLFPMALSDDATLLFAGGNDTKIKAWDLTTGTEISTFEGHTGHVLSLALSADGQRLISGSFDKTIKVWNVQTAQEMLTLRGHRGDVGCLALSRDDRRLFSGGGFFLEDDAIKLWDLTTGKEILTLPAHPGVARLSLSSQRLVSLGRDGIVKFWELDYDNQTR